MPSATPPPGHFSLGHSLESLVLPPVVPASTLGLPPPAPASPVPSCNTRPFIQLTATAGTGTPGSLAPESVVPTPVLCFMRPRILAHIHQQASPGHVTEEGTSQCHMCSTDEKPHRNWDHKWGLRCQERLYEALDLQLHPKDGGLSTGGGLERRYFRKWRTQGRNATVSTAA